jgi:serine/threonine-protein kinase
MSLIGKSIGNYQIKAKLGEGGMGAVYLGEHPLIGKRVAIKVLLEELAAKEDIVARFFTEAKSVNDIGHQNIVDIVDFGKMKGESGQDVVYFIMEFLDGESLAARLRRTGLSFKETMHVMSQCCSALAASHAKGIVHRDLKPENIYLCPRGNDKNFVKILDFGIAKLTGDGPAGSSKTRTGLVIGTPSYMSPEQCEGKGQIDARSDVYSLGVVMYELLTGRVPFPGDGFGEILVAHLTRQPDNPSTLNPDIKPEVEAIVLHALEKDRNRRFQNMQEFQQAVENPAEHYQTYSQTPGFAGTAGATSGPGAGTMVLGGSTGAMGAVKGPITATGPRPTTLSGAASEVGAQAGGKSKAPLFIGVAAVLVLGGGGMIALRGGKKEEPKPEVKAAIAAPAPPPVVKDETVTITITSEPAGARVLRADNGQSGTTPWELKLKKTDAAFDIQVKLDGYTPQTKTIKPDISKEILVTMAKIAAPPPPPPVAAAPKRPSSSGPSRPRTRKPTESPDDMKLLTPKF